jgi:hypothetical protein
MVPASSPSSASPSAAVAAPVAGVAGVLVWLTGPLSPGLSTRTDTFVFADAI